MSRARRKGTAALQICYPKQTDRPLYRGLITQCQSLRLPFIETSDVEALDLRDFDVVIDALFGFSFSGTPRPPFDTILRKLASSASGCLLASVDIPSGWHVENGPAGDGALQPDLLVSLTAPKLSAKHFEVPLPSAAVHLTWWPWCLACEQPVVRICRGGSPCN